MQYVSNFFGGYQPVTSNDANMSTNNSDSMDMSSQLQGQSMNSFGISTQQPQQQQQPSMNSFGISTTNTTDTLTSSLSSTDINSQKQQQQTETTTSWFHSLWANQPQDEMSTIYDVESQSTIQTNAPHEQNMSKFQFYAIKLFTAIQKRLPNIKFPELTYTQRLISFLMFSIAGIFLLLNSLMNLTTVFFGGASHFAMSFTMANIFFICASIFITNPASHFVQHRRFTTFLYLGSLLGTLLAAVYLPYALIVLPLLLVQLGALVLHVLSFFTSAVNVEYNIGQALVTSMFRQVL